MSEEVKGVSDAPEQAASGDASETDAQKTSQDASGAESTGLKDFVKYETYKRTVAEAKKMREQLEAERARSTELEQAKLAAEGKKDELLESYKKQLQEKDAKLKETYGNFAYASVKAQIVEQAAQMGCIDTAKLMKHVDFDSLDIDDQTYLVDGNQLKHSLDSLKNEMPYFFDQKKFKTASHVPNVSSIDAKEDVSKLTNDQIIDRLKQTGWST